jgi:ATP-dependent helicase/DNAse subunit B
MQQKIDLLENYLLRIADADERRDQKDELDRLRRALRSFDVLVERVEGLERPLTSAEFRASVLGLIARLRVAENVLELRRTLDAHARTPLEWQRIHDGIEQDTRALARFLQLLDELAEFFEVKEDLVTAGEHEERRPLEFYLEQLRTAVARARFDIREKHDFGVLVTSFAQMRGIDSDIVILCGLVDGEFPSTYVPEIFLGRPLPRAEERRMRRERIEFYQAITTFSDRLFLTYPRFSGERALVRSSFVDAFLRITTVEERGRVLELNELRAEREHARRNGATPERGRFLALIGSPAALAEEAGTALWSGTVVPQVPGAQRMIDHLRFTATVERGRHDAKVKEDERFVPEYRGIIGGALSMEEQRELGESLRREYSVSQLELYGRCPFKYFARRILAAEAPATFDVSLTPLERGTLLHRVLFRLYVDLRDREELPVTEASRPRALERARELAREEIAGIVFDHPYWRIDQERLLGSDQIGGLLEQWIDYEAFTNAEKSRMVPAYFETAFGTATVRGGSSDPLLSEERHMELHGINVRGKVDRIELFYEGEDLYFAVADYKTGQAPSRDDVLRGLSLQLMVYLEAVRQILAQRFEIPLVRVKPVGGIYYQLKPREADVRVTYLFVPNELRRSIVTMNRSSAGPESVEELEAVIAHAFEFARQYVEGIAAGMFPVTKHDMNVICRGCDYRSACRVSEVGIVKA